MTLREPEAYGRLCAEYYDIDKPRAEPQTLKFYMDRAVASIGPILEPMCGTGSFLLPMAEAGLEISGFDSSPWMLAILQRKARKLHLKPNVWRGLISGLQRERGYGTIFIPNGSFNLLVHPGEPEAALRTFHDHLLPGGMLAFDLETDYAREPGGGDREPWVGWVTRPRGGRRIRLTALAVDELPGVETSLSKYEVMHGDHVEESEAEIFRIRHFSRDTVAAWLAEAGYREVRFLKSHTETPAAEGDAFVSVEALK